MILKLVRNKIKERNSDRSLMKWFFGTRIGFPNKFNKKSSPCPQLVIEDLLTPGSWKPWTYFHLIF